MKLYLARHGRTNYNDLGLCNADPKVDVHLTSVGIAQVENLADRLKQIQLDHIFISELRRTRQSAEIVNKYRDVKITADSRLNDHRSGFEGKYFGELDKALDAASNRWTARFNGGESIEDIKTRVADFTRDLRTENYESVLIVTSQWVIYAMIAIIENLSNEKAWGLEVNQGSYHEIEI